MCECRGTGRTACSAMRCAHQDIAAFAASQRAARCCPACSDKPVTGYSIYNVTPDKAAQYFNKIQCFCFEEQRLRAKEVRDIIT